MFVQGRSLLSSLIIHLLLFLLIWGYFVLKTPPLPLLPQRRVVNVTVKNAPLRDVPVKSAPPIPREASREKPAASPPAPTREEEPAPIPVRKKSEEKPITPPNETVPVREAVKSEPKPIEPVRETPAPSGPLPEKAQDTSPGETASDGNGEYSYSFAEMPLMPAMEESISIPREDFSLDHLLIAEEKSQEGVDSLYNIELTGNRNREILSLPELLFDMKDPVLGTLSDCRISFSVTEEGLVRDIHMIPPGTGSGTYDEILETLLSRFLFSPGDAEEGTIAINFSRINGVSHD